MAPPPTRTPAQPRVLRCYHLARLWGGAALLILTLIYLWLPRRYARILDGAALDIPYLSDTAAYRERAAHVAPLPRGNLDAGAEAHIQSAALWQQQQQQQPPSGVQTRARRQEALEAEIDAYLAAHGIRRERRTRVRFHVLSNVVDWKVCTALGSAALAGFSVPVTGFDAPYSHVHRFKKYLDFAHREGLRDGDIVVTLDSDIFWTGADFLPFLGKFARFSPETEADLDVAAARAWEDYGEKKAPLFMRELQEQAEAAGSGADVKRPDMQMPPIVYNADDQCWWGQHTEGLMQCPLAFATMDHLIEVARNHVSSCDMSKVGGHVRKCGDALRTQLTETFTGDRRWMADDMLRRPNASSPYTTKTQRPRSDPLFYHPSVVRNSNPTVLLNGGMHVSRVWALRRLDEALDAYLATEEPAPEKAWEGSTQWKCDQGLIGEMYTRARLFEVEHNLLTGPPPSARTPPVPYDPRFGPPGLLGLDRRSEMVVLATTIELNPRLFHRSAYLNRYFPASGAWWVRNETELLLGDNEPTEEWLGGLSVSRGGALVTPPLLWRSDTAEDRERGYENAVEDDPDAVFPPFLHYAAPAKHRRFTAHRNYYAWLVAARHDRRAREAVAHVLRKELVELWLEKGRVYVNFSSMCEDPTQISQP